MRYLVTGAAGFIGFHTTKRLLDMGFDVVGIDSVNDYYDVRLKEARLQQLDLYPNFRFYRIDIADRERFPRAFFESKPQRVINLAAQAGVRYSVTNPHAYVDSSLVGFVNVLEACRNSNVEHLVYASSSSVYGGNTKVPFSTHDNVDHPLSLYAATKKANELMSHTYSHLYRMPTTGLRFFTVYGPWGRPDMAYYSFAEAILKGRPIKLFNNGQMHRDFTYIDDIVEGIVRIADRVPSPNPKWSSDSPDPSTSNAPYKLYNIGRNDPVDLLTFVSILERCLGRTAIKELLPIQPGDVVTTCADIEELSTDIGFRPSMSLETGLARFVDWFLGYNRL